MFQEQFIQQLLTAAKPELKALIKEVIAEQNQATEPMCVDYGQAGRMLGTSYEGVRKLVGKGALTAVSRGRRRCIAVTELKAYMDRNQIKKLV